jgi:hypothetical protein
MAAPQAAPAPVQAALTTSSGGAMPITLPGSTPGTSVVAYPKPGETAEEQARDRYDCYQFAVAQTGFDPMRTYGIPANQLADRQANYSRAQAACFGGRGYTVR